MWEFIRIGAARKTKELTDLTQAMSDLEPQHTQSLAIEAATALLELRKKLLNFKAQKILFAKKGFFYEHRHKTGKYLTKALKETLLSTNIAAIKKKDNHITQDTKMIAQRFHYYYTDLYNLPNTHKPKDLMESRTELIHKFLLGSGLSTLNDTDSQSLEDPIREMELIEAIKSLNRGESPGPDGLTPHYYKAFSVVLILHMLKTFNCLKDPQEIPANLLGPYVTVLPKPGEDPLDCASYRPIYLLNIDLAVRQNSCEQIMTIIAPIERPRTGRFYAG